MESPKGLAQTPLESIAIAEEDHDRSCLTRAETNRFDTVGFRFPMADIVDPHRHGQTLFPGISNNRLDPAERGEIEGLLVRRTDPDTGVASGTGYNGNLFLSRF